MNKASGVWQTTCAAKVIQVLRYDNMSVSLNRLQAGLSGWCVKIAACAGMYSSSRKSFRIQGLESPLGEVQWRKMPKRRPFGRTKDAPIADFTEARESVEMVLQ